MITSKNPIQPKKNRLVNFPHKLTIQKKLTYCLQSTSLIHNYKTPSGKYPLTALFRNNDINQKMPFIKTHPNLYCIDDSKSINYNKKRGPMRGSCIFIRIQKSDTSPTAGWIALRKEDIVKLLKAIDKTKNPTVEIKEC